MRTAVSLFSGIGLLDLAAQRAGFEIVAQVEIEEAAVRVLEARFPGVRRYRDVREVGAAQLPRDVDLIVGGFPCQDASSANTQGRGLDGERTGLWREYRRIIEEARPRVAEAEADDGSLAGITAEDVATEVDFDGEPARLFEALSVSGIIEAGNDGLLLHGFAERSGVVISKSRADRMRLKESRVRRATLAGRSPDAPASVSVTYERTNVRPQRSAPSTRTTSCSRPRTTTWRSRDSKHETEDHHPQAPGDRQGARRQHRRR